MDVKVAIDKEAYRKTYPNKSWPDRPNAMTAQAVADTGAQICTAGSALLREIDGATSWLLETKHRLKGVNNEPLDIKGALIVTIESVFGKTTEMLYICDKVNGVYLSQTALKRLHVIHQNFPTAIAAVTSESTEEEPRNTLTAPCGCPKRSTCPPPPEKIPFPATDEHRHSLEEWIKERYAGSAFNTCPHQQLHAMTGEPLKITFLPNHQPFAAHKPIPIPHHWKSEVKAQLDSDVDLGIIEPVPQGTPTTWCSRMIVVPKKDGTPRRTVDLQKLNKATHRETHHTPSPFNIVNGIPAGKKKTVLDAWNGYHSVLLSPDARDATTFITEWGRYRYLRAPQGFHASGDGYTKRFDDITSAFPRVARCIDDSLLWDDDIANSFWHTIAYIQLCSENGIVFNPKKFRFAEDTIEFAGFDVTPTGFKPPERLINDIRNFPSPTNITGVRSWFGLVNQISYAFAQAPVMSQFRELLSKRGPFYWDDALEMVFQESKEKIIESIERGVKTFEVNRPTWLATDWSKTGIGFTLSQKHCDCIEINNPFCGENHWKVNYAGSRFTKDSESRYAPIEGESLALWFGLNSCRMFVLGCPRLIVTVDHKPLVPIFNDRDLDRIENPRVQTFRERTLPYRFTTIAIPGEKNSGPNALSRVPVAIGSVIHQSDLEFDDIESSIQAVVATMEHDEDYQLKRIRQNATSDTEYQELLNFLSNRGFTSERRDTPPRLLEYWSMRNDIYVLKDVIFAAGKPLIPKNMRAQILSDLHIGHQGVNSMKANARQRFFWPGMHKQIAQKRMNCQRCNEIAPSQRKEKPIEGPNPDYPFQMVVTDIFHMSGYTFIIYADRYSGWTEVAVAKNPNADAIIGILRGYFPTFGVPEELSSDGGPPFNSYGFKTFLQTWGIRHRNSSAHYPQSNGRAESAVKVMKRILTTNISPSGSLDTDAVVKALLLHRNTPPVDMGVSPAELLFGRNLTDHMPKPVTFRREWSELADLRERAHATRFQNAQKYATTTEMQPLKIGDAVSLQNQRGNCPTKWNTTGTVVNCLPHRQYQVLVDGSRRCTLRNRRFLRRTSTPIVTDEEPILPPIMPVGDHRPTLPIAPTAENSETAGCEKPLSLENERMNELGADSEEPTIRRSTRARRAPSHFKDFVMTK